MDLAQYQNKNVLFCILNWGLGHATRSMVLINQIQRVAKNFTIASDGLAGEFIQKEYPDLDYISLPSYNISYPFSSITLNILSQFQKIKQAIRQEAKVINELSRNKKLDYIISDNRYGCHSNDCYNIFLGHQLNLIHTYQFFSRIANFFHDKLLTPFEEIWVPDHEDHSLTGKLSQNKRLQKKICYLGPISSVEKMDHGKIDFTCLVITSGPEPQRSIFEKLLIKQLKYIAGKHALVRGTNSENGISDNIEVFNLLGRKELSQLISKSKLIISRSGYSSIMDYEKLGIKALLIPTPGQNEQEYLADHFLSTGRHFVQMQSNINLHHILNLI